MEYWNIGMMKGLGKFIAYQGKVRTQKHDQRKVILKPARIGKMACWNTGMM